MPRSDDEAERIERDSLGPVTIPGAALWGAQTQRAIDNFAVSGLRLPVPLLRALGEVKLAACRANRELGLLDPALASAIEQASGEVATGLLDDQFPVDVFQTGSGTSTNMNANEVIASRANRLRGAQAGGAPVHPNDHVNLGQSSNDVFPTALHVAGALVIDRGLAPALAGLALTLRTKADELADVLKTGRTHLQDATPVRFGQVFGGYATQAERAVERAGRARDALLEVPLGGTAVGTGLNRHPGFPALAISHLREATGLPFVEAADHFEAQGARDGAVEAHGHLRVIAGSLTKIANDLRWLASGPRAGLGELVLPALQPGSSIMPGKVNPVLCEAVVMVAAQVAGHDVTVGICGAGGHFELNAMQPLLAHCLISSATWLANVTRLFASRCVAGLEADPVRCEASVERSLALATALAPYVGYDRAAEVAKEAHASGRTVREVASEWDLLPADVLDAALDARAMTEPGVPGRDHG